MRPTTTAALAAAMLAGCLAAAPVALAQPEPPPSPDPAPAADELATTIDANGTYAVGTDIAPGVYQSAGPLEDRACYWKRTAGDELVDNALTKKPAVVEIKPTDTSFTTSECQVWQLTNLPPPPEPPPGDLLGQLTKLIAGGVLSGGGG